MRTARMLIDRSLGWLLAALMAVAVINVLWQIFTRFVMRHPSSFTEEAARYLLVWISVIGAGYAVGCRAHLAIDLLPTKLRGHVLGAVLAIGINGCMILFALLVLTIGGYRFASKTLELGETSPAFGLKVGYVYAALPVAGAIIILYAVLNTIEQLRATSAPPQDHTDGDNDDRPPANS